MPKLQITGGLVVDYSDDGWVEYVKWLDGTYAKLQFVWIDEGLAYSITAIDGEVYRTFSINKTDATDFETNYKVLDPKQVKRPTSPDGTPNVAQQKLTLGQEEFLRTDNGTAQMNIDGIAAGAPVVLWNGTGAGDSGADWTSSGTGSETAGSMHAGTNGWDTGVTALNDDTTFDNGSLVDVVGTYDELRFWLQPKAFPTNSRLRVGFLDAANNLVGNWRRVEQYATNMDLDVWQQVALPIADFALTADVQKIQFQYRITAGQHHWVDDIELVASVGGGPYRFQVAAPDVLTQHHVSMIVLVVAAPSAGWDPTAFANIVSGLSNGLLIRQRRISDGEILWKLNSKDNLDLFGRFHPQDDITFANGDLLVGFMIKPGKASVIITDDEVLEFVVRDDLSTLTNMRGYVHYGTEIIPA